MKESKARTYFARDELDLIGDIVSAAHTSSESPAATVNRPGLIGLLRKLLVNGDRLQAYCRLLINGKADDSETPLAEQTVELVLKNDFEQMNSPDLLKLAADIDALSVLHDMLQEEYRDEWVDAIIEDGADYIRKKGAKFRSAEEMLHEIGFPFPPEGDSQKAAHPEQDASKKLQADRVNRDRKGRER